jgi:hypothetical protein
MTIALDHLMVPARDKVASARRLGELLGVPWSATGRIHYCFRVSEAEFDSILGRIRAAGIPFRSDVHGPVDNEINTRHGGRIVYWSEPDGHYWEMLTESYARKP